MLNTLSWSLYLVDIIGNLQGALVGGIMVGGLIAIFSGAIFLMSSAEGDEDVAPRARWWLMRSIVYVTVFSSFAIVLPSTTTMRLIVASELGETMVTNPEVVEVFDLLKQELKAQISQAKKE